MSNKLEIASDYISAIFFAKDDMEAKMYSKAKDMAIFIHSLDNLHRKYSKYMDNLTEDQEEIIEKIFSDIFKLKEDNNIVVEDIIN